jgi:hypothetical protein
MPIVKKLFVVKNLSDVAVGTLKYGAAGGNAELRLEYPVFDDAVFSGKRGESFGELNTRNGAASGVGTGGGFVGFRAFDGAVLIVKAGDNFKEFRLKRGRVNSFRLSPLNDVDKGFFALITENEQPKAYASSVGRFDFEPFLARFKGRFGGEVGGGIKRVSDGGNERNKTREAFNGNEMIEETKGEAMKRVLNGEKERSETWIDRNEIKEGLDGKDERNEIKEELREVFGGAVDELSEDFYSCFSDEKAEELEKKLKNIIKKNKEKFYRGKGENSAGHDIDSIEGTDEENTTGKPNEGDSADKIKEITENNATNEQGETRDGNDEIKEMTGNNTTDGQGGTREENTIEETNETDIMGEQGEIREERAADGQEEATENDGRGETAENGKANVNGNGGFFEGILNAAADFGKKSGGFYESAAGFGEKREGIYEGAADFGKKNDGFYEGIKRHLDEMLELYPAEGDLNRLVHGGKFVRISCGKDGCYVVGLYMKNDKPEYICYGVPGEFGVKPTGRLKEIGRWFPIDFANKEGRGYWLIFQSPQDGSIVKK